MKKILSAISIIFMLFSAKAQTDLDMVKSTVSKNDIQSHIYFLASDELRGRETGSPEIDIAAAYLANTLHRYGVKPAGDNDSFYQYVQMEKVSPPKQIFMKLNDFQTDKFILFNSYKTDYKGDVIYLNYGLEEDFKDKDVKGKLVLAKSGTAEDNNARSSFRTSKNKVKIAKENGAVGLIELSSADTDTWNMFSHYFNGVKTQLVKEDKKDKFIHLWLQDTDKMLEMLLSSEVTIRGNLNISERITESFTSRNVVGIVEGTDPKLKDEYIIYSAHYDHNGVGKPNAQMDSIYNGARDNAVGTVTVLSAAENIAKYPTKRSALFILFTGEEKGLLGSQWYVDHPVVPLKQMVYCFNSDNGGYNDTTKATIIGLNRTTANKNIINAVSQFGLTAIDDPAPEQGLFDRSDNVRFAAKGIPAPTFSMGFTSFDDEIYKYYHQVTDNPDTMDYDYLTQFFKAYVLACRLIANDDETPFWTEGDKYFEAGKKLYGKK
jgi:peptidase M28-like protein